MFYKLLMCFRYIATTKFEPTYARRSFPCFDEPSFKSKYNVSLVRPSTGNYIALSNMNQVVGSFQKSTGDFIILKPPDFTHSNKLCQVMIWLDFLVTGAIGTLPVLPTKVYHILIKCGTRHEIYQQAMGLLKFPLMRLVGGCDPLINF